MLSSIFYAHFSGAGLAILTKIRAYIIVTFSMNTSQFSISRNVFLNSVVFFGVFNELGRDGLPLHITVCFLKGKNSVVFFWRF